MVALLAGLHSSPALAVADCWGKVAFLYMKSTQVIELGMYPDPGKACSCSGTVPPQAAIGPGAYFYTFAASLTNNKESYAALLASVTTKTSVFVTAPDGSCAATGVLVYPQ